MHTYKSSRHISYRVGCTKKEDVAQDIQKYWPIRHEFAMIDDIALKGK